jgi:hypothetical protein
MEEVIALQTDTRAEKLPQSDCSAHDLATNLQDNRLWESSQTDSGGNVK